MGLLPDLELKSKPVGSLQQLSAEILFCVSRGLGKLQML